MEAPPIKAEGFGGDVAYAPPPEGFAASSGGPPPKVEGFGAAATPGSSPPVEGFGDSADTKGLGSSGEGYLDEDEENNTTTKPKEVDVGPGTEEEESAEASRFTDIEPGWEDVVADDKKNADNDEEQDSEEKEDSEQGRYSPFITLAAQNRPFTAQLKAAGFGGFHEWQMNFLKKMIENKKSS